MKKTKIVVPALAVLLLSTAASVSGTVAWFSMNTSINVSGMQVKTKVSSNLQISVDNVEAHFSNEDLEQSRAAYLEPASTVDGENYYYTINANGEGAAKPQGTNGATTYTAYAENASTPIASTLAGKTNYDKAFNDSYTFTAPAADAQSATINDTICYAYVDYSFFLKGTAANASQSIYMSKCLMQYKGGNQTQFGELSSGLAWRVCLFAKSTTQGTDVTDAQAAVAANNKSIMKFSTADNHTSGYAVTDETSTLGEVENADDPAIVASNLTPGEAVYYKVVVRLWLEGEDTTCTNETYATLTGDWSLSVDFNLDGNSGTQAASTITTAPAAQQQNP